MRKYRYILFDLDHTLWDFNRNSEETLYQLYDDYHLVGLEKFSRKDFVEKFQDVNNRLWDMYDKDAIDKLKLRKDRFRLIFDELKFHNYSIADKIGDDYFRVCPEKIHLIPHTTEVLEYLRKHYSLYILTNGFSETQFRQIMICLTWIAPYSTCFVRLVEKKSLLPKKPAIKNPALKYSNTLCR